MTRVKHFAIEVGLQPLCRQRGRKDLTGSIKGTTCKKCQSMFTFRKKPKAGSRRGRAR